ncbi:SDR family oxidoreductase [Alteromonas facilis]|uniref:SDR family oxidoreductase n=1 Tax=Alteromonas facilis TaxID=2048004 RepID=UPI0013DC379A|nr:SDR family oxidoreductase [Alteromonas facilis]
MNTTNKRCLVTGASGGIGGEIAKALDAEGYSVILQGRNHEKLLRLQASMSNRTDIVLGDLNEQSQREQVLEKAFAKGPIELLINAAGISSFKAFEQASSQEISNIFQTNLLSPVLFTQAFLAYVKANSEASNVCATIVNVGSAFGYIGYPGFSNYCASKFGLRGFTEALAREYSDSNVKFIYFAPRATQTEINSQSVDDMNLALGNKVDSAQHVAQALIQMLKKHKRESVVGWPEKLFARVNAVAPGVVDNAIKSKLSTIKRYLHA